MTQYSNIPQVNTLYLEQQRVQSAIAMIDDGGTLTSLTISPPLPPAYDPTTMISMPMPQMPVSVSGIDTATGETMATIRAQLVARDAEISAELASLGVVAA